MSRCLSAAALALVLFVRGRWTGGLRMWEGGG